MSRTSHGRLILDALHNPAVVRPHLRVGAGNLSNALAHMQRIGNARTPEELWGHLLAALADYGFDRVNYGATRSNRDGSIGDIQDAVFLSNHPRNVMSDYFDMGFFMRTPMFRWVMQNTGACSWGWAEAERRAGRLSPEELVAQDMARKSGMVAGYSISFADPSPRSRAAMGLSAGTGLTQDQVDAMWAQKGGEIMAICQMMHLRMQGMPFPVQRRPLSPRQREALEWVAEGKTTQDIAIIMGISPAMVEKHLRLAREALDVETTAHAVAKAALFNHLFAGDHVPFARLADRG
jgi:LuxR family transcriptional regulator, activator of conjugal transfer of Ti plasmids